jgi:proline iminopeptidase
MKASIVGGVLAQGLVLAALPQADQRRVLDQKAADMRIAAGATSLYAREVGSGHPVIVLHGGPDFDHGYLLPELDALADAVRLIYYDQRGRGRSAENVSAEDVTLETDLADLDRVREHFRLDSVALLGHSWGAVLALEYALRHPARVSHLVLMNPAPVSSGDLAGMRQEYVKRLGADMDRQRAIVASAEYRAADPETVAARYRIHFKPALKKTADYETMMTRMRQGFLRQGKDGILKARAVEDRLMRDTWEIESYNLLPKLASLGIPTLVIAGDHDFMAGSAERIAQAMPGAELVMTKNCGHFAFLECPAQFRDAFDRMLAR